MKKVGGDGMAKICGSVEGAERFRMKVEKENRKSIEIWKKINRELKNLQESGAQEAYEQLQQICNSYGKQFQKVLEELAGVLKQMQMYRDFLVAISRNASLGGAMHAPPARPTDMGQVLLSGKAHEIPRQPLAQQDQVSFQGGAYDTVQTTEELVLYRVYGGASSRIGRFLTTRMPTDRMVAKMELALDASWKGTRTQYCEVHIPAGTVLNIGRAGGQVTASGNLLPGGAVQVLLSAEQCQGHADWYGEGQELRFVQNFLNGTSAETQLEPQTKKTHLSVEGKNGSWIGERGKSDWVPSVPEQQEVMQRYGKNSVLFKDGYPDFEPFAAFETHLEPAEFQVSDRVQFKACSEAMSDFWASVAERYCGAEFDDPLNNAEYRSLLKKTFRGKDDELEEIQEALENAETPYGYTWHHDLQAGRMLLIPTVVHMIPHEGGRLIWGGGKEKR